MASVSVRLNNITKRFGEKTVLDRFSFSAPEGQITTLLGPSGSGKSTAIRLIAGLDNPNEGEIWLGDEAVYLEGRGEIVQAERRDIGMVFQAYALWPHKTVAENVAFPLRVRHVAREEIQNRIRETLALVKLMGYEERFPGQLSGGEQQRVALARALVYQPRILLLDEPLANIDAVNREYLRFELCEIQRRVGITTIYVTHDQAEAMVISDIMIVINKGRIVQVGTPQDIYDKPKDDFVAGFLGVCNFLTATVKCPGIAAISDAQEIAWHSAECSDQNLKPGDHIILSIRPQHIHFTSEQSDRQKLHGKVVNRVYTGTMTEYWVQSGDVSIRVQSQAIEGPALGEEVNMILDPKHLRILPVGRKSDSVT